MIGNRLKNSIIYLFLALFISMKLAGLHVLAHADDKDHLMHCVVCDHTIALNHDTPILPPNVQEFNFENTEPVLEQKQMLEYGFMYNDTRISNFQLSRPPPDFL